MKTSVLIGMVLGGLGVLGTASVLAQDPAGQGSMTIVAPGDLKWTDAPPALPKGAKMAVLYGDPGKSGLFVMRVKLPANYKVAPHWHPADENLSVVSGTLFIGHGDKFDAAAGKPIATGAYAMMPAKMHHFAYTKKETVFDLSAMGPWGITYVNPADDPSKTAATTTAK